MVFSLRRFLVVGLEPEKTSRNGGDSLTLRFINSYRRMYGSELASYSDWYFRRVGCDDSSLGSAC